MSLLDHARFVQDGWEPVPAACLPACKGCDRRWPRPVWAFSCTCLHQRAYEKRVCRNPNAGLLPPQPTPEFMLR